MSTDTETFPEVGKLSLACLDVTGVQFDWSEGYGEAWEVVLPSPSCSHCEHKLAPPNGEYVEVPQSKIERDECGDLRIKGTDIGVEGDEGEYEADIPHEHCMNPECEEFGQAVDAEDWEGDYGPMFNYYYPLPEHHSFDAEDADKLSGVSLVIVIVNGEPALALSGCGMDFSWDICEAFMRLGYLPPTKYCELPVFAGRDTLTSEQRWIVDGCKRSLSMQVEFLQRQLNRLKETWG